MTALRATLDVSAVPERPAGAGRYTIEIARALQSRSDVEMTLLARRSDVARWELGGSKVFGETPDSRVGRMAHERWRMGPRVDRLGVSVHHGPHYTMPRRMRTPAVVTIHDVTYFERPEVHEAAKVRFFSSAIRRAAAEAGALVCVSMRTAERLTRHVEVSVPVVVAPHGIDHERFHPTEHDTIDASILDGLGVSSGTRSIVALGTLEPRKGIGDLISAFDVLAASDPDLELLLVGQRGWGMEELDRARSSAAAGDRIRPLGYVEDDAVPALLRHASAVAYPSVDEGFGLPALEALACGSPLVTTAGSVMEELCGEAPWYSTPGDHKDLAETLGKALTASDEERERRRTMGLETASLFTWSRSADRHVEAYGTAAQESASRSEGR